MPFVGLFFYVEGELLLHSVPLEDADPYGIFLNYPESHDQVWQREYSGRYYGDFATYPRGRIIYRKTDQTFLVYHDPTIPTKVLQELCAQLGDGRYEYQCDEHYRCLA